MRGISELRRVLDQEMARLEPTAGMESRVLATTFRGPRAGSKHRGLATAFHLSSRSLQLVAGLLVLAIFASLVVIAHGAHLGIGKLSNTAEAAQIAQLEARPLHLPPDDAFCQADFGEAVPFRGGVPAELYGKGPVYGEAGPKTESPTMHYFDVHYLTDPTVKGPVLVRGGQLDGPQRLLFSGPYAAGPVVGTDVVDGKPVDLHAEVLLPAEHPRQIRAMSPGWAYWPVRQGANAAIVGHCLAVQIDTLSTTELARIGAMP